MTYTRTDTELLEVWTYLVDPKTQRIVSKAEPALLERDYRGRSFYMVAPVDITPFPGVVGTVDIAIRLRTGEIVSSGFKSVAVNAYTNVRLYV